MISPSVAGAVFALQQQALGTRDTYELDRIDRALDELLRNTTDTITPARQRIRSAMGHAYEALERRRAIAPTVPLDRSDRGAIDTHYVVVETLEWLRTESRLTEGERTLLWNLAHGDDANTLAPGSGVPLPRMRERISRARRNAFTLWKGAVQAT